MRVRAFERAGLFLVTLLTASSIACRRPTPEAPPKPAAAPAPLEVDLEGSWLYTYADPKEGFRTVDRVADIPEPSRPVVRVLDPARAGEPSDPSQVHVVDARELLTKRRVTARVVRREAFETSALALLPPGDSSAWAGAPPRAGGAPPETGPAPAASLDATEPVVTVYGTSWCGACKAARAYLTERHIPFADKDIERDPAAARELAEKGRRLGVPTDRVPVLEVRGRLLLGFDRARLEALLGEPA